MLPDFLAFFEVSDDTQANFVQVFGQTIIVMPGEMVFGLLKL